MDVDDFEEMLLNEPASQICLDDTFSDDSEDYILFATDEDELVLQAAQESRILMPATIDRQIEKHATNGAQLPLRDRYCVDPIGGVCTTDLLLDIGS